jgi:hypothetical protein
MTATNSFEVIAGFVDGERVDPIALKSALASSEGRDYLVEMVALREVVGQDGATTEIARARPARRWLVGAAAAILLSLGGGMALGHRIASRDDGAVAGAADVAAPQPTRVIEVAPGASYIRPEGK